MTAEGCPRCGDQTLRRVARNREGELRAWCQLCGHEWAVVERNVFRCPDPEGDWIRDRENEAYRRGWDDAVNAGAGVVPPGLGPVS